MRNVFQHILIASVILSLSCAPIVMNAMPEPTPATQTDKQKAAAQKKKDAEKRKKEQEKAKAAREKQKAADAKKREAEKKKAAAAKATAEKKEAAEKQRAAKAKATEQKREEAAKQAAKAQAERDKEAAARAKAAAEREEARAKKEAAMKNALQQLIGGPGAGIDFTYNLEYGHFLFETGLDFRYLNSSSAYGFQAERTDLTYNAKYNYLFDRMTEMRHLLQVGVPVMFGAQFSRYYFLVGAKIHYSIAAPYSQKGKYDVTVYDPAFIDPYGRGIYKLNGETDKPIKFKQPDVSVAAEFGIDLDEWLQKQPRTDKDAKKKQQQVKAGQRLPFGREHVHYRVALFAEYGVLNTNATPAALPMEFAGNQVEVQKSNTMLAMNGNTKLNNLFVGAKFTIQFEVPGKKARPVPPPPAYAIYSVVDATTNQPLKVAHIETRGTESGKIALREKQIGPKGFRQKHAVGSFTTTAKAEGYYDATQVFLVEKVGETQYVTIAMQPRPVLRVRVYNKETNQVLPATIQIMRSDAADPAYSLTTDSVTGSTRKMLEAGPQYTLHIAQMGYNTVNLAIANIGDSLNIALTPVKKGEVFIVHNLHFATNKTRILSRSEQALNDLYMYLARNPQVRIKIIGHTDNVGKDAANQKLSDGRANAVMKDLIERGIAPERLSAEGRGETQPIDTNDTEEGRQNNRRVEIEIQ